MDGREVGRGVGAQLMREFRICTVLQRRRRRPKFSRAGTRSPPVTGQLHSAFGTCSSGGLHHRYRRDVRVTVVVHRRQRFRGQVVYLDGHISPWSLRPRILFTYGRAVSVSNQPHLPVRANPPLAGYVVIRDVHCPLTATLVSRQSTTYSVLQLPFLGVQCRPSDSRY